MRSPAVLRVVMIVTTLSLLSPATVWVVTAVDFGGAGMGKPCPKYRCRQKDHTPVPKPRSMTKFESTGCASVGGGGGGGGISMMGGGIGGTGVKPYEHCCHYFHACYQICGMPKKTCDTQFETCATQHCDKEEANAEECKKDISMTKLMIDLGGCKNYDQAQHHACECVAQDTPDGTSKVTVQRGRGLRKFYEKFAPASIDKVPGLLAKAETGTKFANLLMKLVTKYYQADEETKSTIALKPYEDPMQAYYDQMKQDKKDHDHDPPPTSSSSSSSSTTTDEHDMNENEDEEEDDERIEL